MGQSSSACCRFEDTALGDGEDTNVRKEDPAIRHFAPTDEQKMIEAGGGDSSDATCAAESSELAPTTPLAATASGPSDDAEAAMVLGGGAAADDARPPLTPRPSLSEIMPIDRRGIDAFVVGSHAPNCCCPFDNPEAVGFVIASSAPGCVARVAVIVVAWRRARERDA
jgi:hypothetical protein